MSDPRIPCPSEAWDRLAREQDDANPEDQTVVILKCEKHGDTFEASGFCGTCYVEDLAEGERLAKEWRRGR